MAGPDSIIDRVFVHALQTVKKITRTGSARPPARLALYGLYKQAMEGDVVGVMPRPDYASTDARSIHSATSQHDHDHDNDNDQDTHHHQAQPKAEVEKWNAWAAQQGRGKTEAKRRYIDTLPLGLEGMIEDLALAVVVVVVVEV